MTGTNGMTCEDIDKELKHFVGDLLSDTDYQSFVNHLDKCQKCAGRVRSMGSFSNQLWEMGDIEVPSDFDSTICFQFSQARQQPRRSKTKFSKKLVFALVVVIAGIGVAFGAKFFKKADHTEMAAEEQTDEAVVVQATMTKKETQASDPEAERLYKQLKGMAASLEPVAQSAQNAVKKKEAPEEDAQPARDGSVVPSESPANAYSLHWHIPNFSRDAIKQIVGTITMLNINLDYEDQNFIIFTTTSRRIKTISGGIQFTHKIQLEYPEFIKIGSDPERPIVTTVSFTGREPTYSVPGGQLGSLSSFEQGSNASGNGLDWHIMLVSTDQNALLGIIHKHRGDLLYSSKEAIVVSIAGARIPELAKEIQTTGGMFPDYGNSDFGTVSLWGVVHILIYFPEP